MARSDSRTVGVVSHDEAATWVGQVRDALTGADFAVTTLSPDGLDDQAVDCLVVGHDPPALDAATVLADAQANTPTVPVLVFGSSPTAVHETIADHPCAQFVAAGPSQATDLLVSRVRAAMPADPDADDLIDMFDAAVAVFDPDSRQVLAANGPFRRRWGLDDVDVRLDDLLAHPLREEDHPGALVETARGTDQLAEWHCELPDGTRFKTTVRVRVDTDRKRGYLVADPSANDAEEYDDSMLDTLLDHTTMSVYFKDERGRLVAVSDALLEPFIESPEGKYMHTREDVIGKTDFDLYPIPLAEEAAEDDRQVMETGEPVYDTLERVKPPHGPPLYFSTTKAPWYDPEGRLLGIVGVTREVTKRERHKAELERQNERLERFADIISHDLRNPLNVANGRIELYEQTGDPEDLDTVAEMHERMDDLIDDVLTFAREGDQVTDTTDVDGAVLAREAWESVETGDATFASDWDHAIEADPTRLARVFENLFRNSIEHGGDDVAIRIGTLEDTEGFYVEDDGSGIPAEERANVFDRGFSTSDEGTGFGLPIVREIAEAHGWEVSVTESAEGGARFEFVDVTRA